MGARGEGLDNAQLSQLTFIAKSKNAEEKNMDRLKNRKSGCTLEQRSNSFENESNANKRRKKRSRHQKRRESAPSSARTTEIARSKRRSGAIDSPSNEEHFFLPVT